MNIFHIPSWYPNRRVPLEGTFTKDFIYQYASLHKESTHIISNQQEYSYSVMLKKPLASLKEALLFMKTIGHERLRSEQDNVFLLYTSNTLEYSNALGFDSLAHYEKKHFENYKKALKKFTHIDLIHAHVTFPGGIYARKIAEEFNVPYIITEHSGPFPFDFILNNDTYLKELKGALNYAQAVVSVSNRHSKEVIPFTSTPVTVIFNPVFYDKSYPKRTWDTDCCVFLSAALNLDRKKGIPQLINAFASVRSKLKEQKIKLWLIGNPDVEVVERAKELGLDDMITYWGLVSPEEVRRLIGQCDIFAMPSQKESFGLVYAEATMAGKPVIATRCGGPEDIVDEKNGLLIPVDDAGALEQALLYMVEHKNEFDGQEITTRAVQKFAPGTIVNQYHELYTRVVTTFNHQKAN